MAEVSLSKARRFKGKPSIPGDKSISHRGLILGALSQGTTEVLNILDSEDVRSTARCLGDLGIKIESSSPNTTRVYGGPFQAPSKILDCGNSGTTMRLLMGVLASARFSLGSFSATLTGDASLNKRPMKRVAEPLRMMGAQFQLTQDQFAPLTINGAIFGNALRPIDYALPVASAQIKSAIILAAISAETQDKEMTKITGEIHSRDHTERMLPQFGGKIHTSPSMIQIPGRQVLQAAKVLVPGDPSTAAFWMAAAAMIPGAEIELENISLNPTRIGFLDVLKEMGAQVETEITSTFGEPIGKIRVRPKVLKGVLVKAEKIPTLIDEIPILAVVASQAEGLTRIEGAQELRVKESDRLEAIRLNLSKMGIKIDLTPDGFFIKGPQKLQGAQIETFHDHRIAMAFSIAALLADGQTTIHHSECVAVSYPTFYKTLRELTRE